MLTIQTLILLSKLKSINKPVICNKDLQSNTIEIMPADNTKEKYCDGFALPLTVIDNKNLVSKLKLDEFNYLIENNYIFEENNFICIKHEGYHKYQISFLKFWKFIYRSILTPIAVAILTTILWNYFFK